MQKHEITTHDLVAEASGTGQLLTVIYHGGRAPGHKRRIMIRSIDDNEMQVREFPDEVPKTYLVSRTTVVDENDPAPWMPESVGKAIAIEPESYFSKWTYPIPEYFFSALGVNLRYVIDQEKTKPAREKAIAEGMSKTEATKRIKIIRREFAINTPPAYDFHEGDIFYRGGCSGLDWLQVVKIKNTDAVQSIEIHVSCTNGRNAFYLSSEELAHILKTGNAPPIVIALK